jgi:hypothetical protein
MADQDLSHLDTFESLRRFLYKIAEYEESLRLEILALRATLETYANPKSPEDPPLEETVMLLKNDPIVKRLVHRDFESNSSNRRFDSRGEVKHIALFMDSKRSSELGWRSSLSDRNRGRS